MISYSNTRLTTFKRCRLKYHWQYVNKQEQKEAVALRRGRAAHVALASYYKGESLKNSVAAAWAEYAPMDRESLEKMDELDIILTRYLRWAVSKDMWKVLDVEKTVEVKYGPNKLMGIWDLLVFKQGKNYIVDHKFQKSHTFSNLEVDPQVSHYLALAKLMGIEVQGLIYNIVNLDTGNVKEIAFREIVGRKDHFIQAYLDNLAPQIKEIKKAQKGTLPIYPNWTSDCCWQCSFYRQCVDTPYKVKT